MDSWALEERRGEALQGLVRTIRGIRFARTGVGDADEPLQLSSRTLNVLSGRRPLRARLLFRLLHPGL